MIDAGPDRSPASLDVHQLNFAVDIVAVFCSLLLAGANVARLPKNRNALLVSAMLIFNVCSVLLTRQDYSYWIPEPYRIDVGAWKPVLNIARNLTPGLFMLLCYALFQERRRFPAWLLALFALQVLLEPADLVLPAGLSGQHLLTEVVPGTLESLFACLAIYWTVAGWTSDLVETRRRLRWLIVIVLGVLILGSSLLLRVVIPWDSVQNYYAHVVLTTLGTAVMAAILLSLIDMHEIEQYLNPDRVPASTRSEPDAVRDAAATAIARLEQLMGEDKVYRQPGLSVASLAQQMGLPEYRLRRLIHERLGHRNFNVFLHEHRIREACELLQDSEQGRTPILTIALSVGYQSINTFNRGFREVTGMTPSTYRAARPAPAGDGIVVGTAGRPAGGANRTTPATRPRESLPES